MRESRYAALSMIRRSAIWPLLVVVALFLVACTSSDSATPSPGADDALPSDPPVEAGDGTVRLAADADTRIYRIVTLGDSYTIGTGTEAPRRDSWPAQMYTALTERGEMRLKLVNLARRSSPSSPRVASRARSDDARRRSAGLVSTRVTAEGSAAIASRTAQSACSSSPWLANATA